MPSWSSGTCCWCRCCCCWCRCCCCWCCWCCRSRSWERLRPCYCCCCCSCCCCCCCCSSCSQACTQKTFFLSRHHSRSGRAFFLFFHHQGHDHRERDVLSAYYRPNQKRKNHRVPSFPSSIGCGSKSRFQNKQVCSVQRQKIPVILLLSRWLHTSSTWPHCWMLKLATSASKNQAASGLSEGHVMILRYVPHTTYVIYKTNFGTVEYHIPMDHAYPTLKASRWVFLYTTNHIQL